jgi:nicotinate-nucleotide--dimethylbenzimidazole phosphoribosyltransferase
MDAPAAPQPLGGWYSSHWSIAPASILTRPFTFSSGRQVQQPLAGLQDLYSRAAFLLGLTGDLPPTAGPATGTPPPWATGRLEAEAGPKAAARPPDLAGKAPPTHSRLHVRTTEPPEAEPMVRFPTEASGSADRPATPIPGPEAAAGSGDQPTDNPDNIAAKAEALVAAANRLAAALEAHAFLAPSLREYGAEVISRFTQTLAPLGLGDAGGSPALDGEQAASTSRAYPDQVAEALWGPNSLTPELTSLAAAIVGAPGIFLVQATHQAPETYQPFQGPHPWFRVAPAHFHQVA